MQRDMPLPYARSHCLFVTMPPFFPENNYSLMLNVPELLGYELVQVDLTGETLLSAIRSQVDGAVNSAVDADHLAEDILIPVWVGAGKSALILRSPSQMRWPDPIGCLLALAKLIHLRPALPPNAGRLVVVDVPSYFDAHRAVLTPLFTLRGGRILIPEEAA